MDPRFREDDEFVGFEDKINFVQRSRADIYFTFVSKLPIAFG